MSGMCRRGAGQGSSCTTSGLRRGGLPVSRHSRSLGGFQPYLAVPAASTCPSRPTGTARNEGSRSGPQALIPLWSRHEPVTVSRGQRRDHNIPVRTGRPGRRERQLPGQHHSPAPQVVPAARRAVRPHPSADDRPHGGLHVLMDQLPTGNGVPRFADRDLAARVDSLPAARFFRPPMSRQTSSPGLPSGLCSQSSIRPGPRIPPAKPSTG